MLYYTRRKYDTHSIKRRKNTDCKFTQEKSCDEQIQSRN